MDLTTPHLLLQLHDLMLKMGFSQETANTFDGWVMLVGIILFFTLLFVWGVWRKVDSYRKKMKLRKRRHHNKNKL
jgi:hypothetical protein